MTTATTNERSGLRNAAGGRGSGTQRPVPPWARRIAHAVPLVVLPSSLWRLPLAFGFDMGMDDTGGGPWVWWALPYTLALIVLTEAFAYLSVGLVSGWGEVVPGWIPGLGGRPVRTRLAVTAATVGGLLVTLLFVVEPIVSALELFGLHNAGFRNRWWAALGVAAYAPLGLWGPMLFAVTVSYARRRGGESIDTQEGPVATR